MGKPAARLTDMHTCPMVTGTVPHVGGPIAGPCAPTVLIGSLPAARVSDMAVCIGPPDVIAMGSPTVLISGMPAARMGDSTAHGGVIVMGLPTVLIGQSGGGGGGIKMTPMSVASTLSSAGVLTKADVQAETMIKAAQYGTPFCERCAPAAAAARPAPTRARRQAPTPAPAPRPPPPRAAPPAAPRLSPECERLATARDHAMLSSHTYDENAPLPPGYRELDPATPAGRAALRELGVAPSDLTSPSGSFKAEVFVRDQPPPPQTVTAFRGTRPTELIDWKQNAQQGVGMQSDSYQRAVRLGTLMSESPAGANASFTGHSLGGGLASAAAVSAGRPATTFNAAGLNARTVGGYPANGPPVDAYYVPGEILSGIQDNRGLALGGLVAAGSAVHPSVGAALAAFVAGNAASGAPVLPQAYGTRRRLPEARPAGAGNGPVARHGMDWVMSGIDAQRRQSGCP